MGKRTYTDEELLNAVKSSKTMLRTLSKLGLASGGASCRSLLKHISQLGADISHWTYKREPEELSKICIINSHYVNTTFLCERLVREGFFKYKCNRCGINEWMDEKLSLHLHHKNGNKKDNRLENLEILCPNCHSLTNNYSGKNIKRRRNENFGRI